MSQENSSGMTQARFAAIVDAYGGDPALWPRGECDAAERFLTTNGAAQILVAQARRLDVVLGVPETDNDSSVLERRLLDDFDRAQRRWSLRTFVDRAAQAIWPGAPVWQPACAIGLAFAAGLCIAVFAPVDIRQQDEGSGGAYALDSAPEMDAGHGF